MSFLTICLFYSVAEMLLEILIDRCQLKLNRMQIHHDFSKIIKAIFIKLCVLTTKIVIHVIVVINIHYKIKFLAATLSVINLKTARILMPFLLIGKVIIL